jgi:hypothetical protein
MGVSSHFWLLNPWRYNQVQKLVLHRYLLNFSLGLCGLILFSAFKYIFLLQKVKKYAQITCALILASYSIFCIFSNFEMLSELQNLNLILCTKQWNKIDLLSPDCGAIVKRWLPT